MRWTLTFALAAGVAALALTLTGCGGGKTVTPTTVKTVTLARWSATVDPLCVEIQQDTEDVSYEDESDFPAYARKMASLLQAFVKDVKAAGVPEGYQTEATDFVALFDESATILAKAAKNHTDSDKVFDKLAAKGPAIDDLASTLEIPSCASSGEDTTTTTHPPATTPRPTTPPVTAPPATDPPITHESWAAAANEACGYIDEQYAGVVDGFNNEPLAWASAYYDMVSATTAAVAELAGPYDDYQRDDLVYELSALESRALTFADAAAVDDLDTADVELVEMTDNVRAVNSVAVNAGAGVCGGF
jgi:hypothetical protein